MALKNLGPYDLKNVVGRGGMGTVYRGIHQKTGKSHAIKVLSPTYATDSHFRNRFESEIKALIKLDHPNIVRLISYGQDEGMLFFSMELVQGKSLFQMQRDGYEFQWREILKIAQDTASGLRHAHDRGVIHRDLKPGNLLWADDGPVKITDFGIAKRFGSSQNTGENVLGTLDYMSPEQAKGESVTVKSDLYSLGTVLFTLLAGKSPFASNSVEQSLRNLTQVPAPHIRSKVSDVPEDIDRLLRSLMDKDPSKRIQTAQALLHKISQIESNLRRYSEAKTAENHRPKLSSDSGSKKGQPTKADHDRSIASDNTLSTTANHPADQPSEKLEVREPTSANKNQTLTEEQEQTEDIERQDFFSTVTEGQRKPKPYIKTEEQKKSLGGILALAAALLLLLIAGAWGIYGAYRIPTADELYGAIEVSLDKPNRVSEELDKFAKYYPDDIRIIEVKTYQGIADAIALKNQLTVQSSKDRNRLTNIERQFLGFAKLSEDDPATAYSRMAAFRTLHSDDETLALRDQKCIEAAEFYKKKITLDAARNVNFGLNKIETALERAEKMDTVEAKRIYEAILELYSDAPWAEEKGLLTKTREKLERLKNN